MDVPPCAKGPQENAGAAQTTVAAVAITVQRMSCAITTGNNVYPLSTGEGGLTIRECHTLSRQVVEPGRAENGGGDRGGLSIRIRRGSTPTSSQPFEDSPGIQGAKTSRIDAGCQWRSLVSGWG